jgi:hypothetical protein
VSWRISVLLFSKKEGRRQEDKGDKEKEKNLFFVVSSGAIAYFIKNSLFDTPTAKLTLWRGILV